MAPRQKHSPSEDRGYIIALHEEGLSTRAIAERLKLAGRNPVNQSTVCRIVKKYPETGSATRKKGSGRPQKLTCRDIRHLKLVAVKHRKGLLQKLPRLPIRAPGMWFLRGLFAGNCRKTISEAVGAPKSRWITGKNIRNRMEWAKAHTALTDDQWAKGAFSDEA